MRAFLYAPSGINRTTSNLYRSMLSSLISLSTNRNYASTRVVRLRPETFLLGLKPATLHCARFWLSSAFSDLLRDFVAHRNRTAERKTNAPWGGRLYAKPLQVQEIRPTYVQSCRHEARISEYPQCTRSI